MRRMPGILVAVIAGLSGVGALAARARAAFPGRAGVVAFQNDYSVFDDEGDGNDQLSLKVWRPQSADSPSNAESCSGPFDEDEGGFDYHRPSVCATGGVSFAPGGRRLAYGGVTLPRKGRTAPPGFTLCPGLSWGCGTGVLVGSLGGGHPTVVTGSLFAGTSPAFMPGGRTIVFAGRRIRKAPLQLYSVRDDGSALTQLTTDGASQPATCPNGRIVFNHRGDLWTMRGVHGAPRRLLRSATLPDCSRDSRTLVFVRGHALYTSTVTGHEIRRLTPPGTSVQSRAALSPAGKRIALTYARCGHRRNCADEDNCSHSTYYVGVIDLHGHLTAHRRIGSDACDDSDYLGGTTLGDVDWQPLRAAAAARVSSARR